MFEMTILENVNFMTSFCLLIQGDLDTQRLLWRKENKSKQERAKLYAVRIGVNVVVLGFLGGSLVAIYYSNDGLILVKINTAGPLSKMWHHNVVACSKILVHGFLGHLS